MLSITLIDELDNKSPDLDHLLKLSETLSIQASSESTDPELLKSLGHLYLAQNNDQKSHEFYQKALLSAGLDDAELWYGIGTMYYKNCNYTYAEPSFLRVLSLDPCFPKHSLVNLKLGLIYKRFSLYSEAIKYFDNCEGVEKAQSSIQSAFCLSKMGSKTEALALFKSSHESSRSPFTALCLGWFLSSIDLNQALGVLHEGMSLCQKDTVEELDLLYAIAQVLYKKKDCGEASNCYYKLLNKNSGDYQIWNSFGIMLAETGQSTQAFRCFIKASELSCNSAEVWNNIGSLYWRSGQLAESKQAYEKALKMNLSSELVKENTKEYVYTEWNVSELPFVKRNISKFKPEFKESDSKSTGFVSASPVQPNYQNNFATMMGYFNFFRQIANGRVAQQRNEDDKAAEILTDLSTDLPNKRGRDS
jgi:tetratricopeptide (TPR) repeat protein